MAYVSIEIDTSEILDELSMNDKMDLLAELQEYQFEEKLLKELCPRQVIYKMRKFNINLPKLRDVLIEMFPIEKQVGANYE